jgi:2-polyprenyl-3-methyl-5-hydroxy-6-metoxy-1,4-benzoquinol methylase
VFLAEQGAQVTAIDISASMIEAGRKRAAHRHVDVDFEVGAAQNILQQSCAS